MAEEIITLLDDPHFKLWVLSPNETEDRFWNQIIENHPEKKEPIENARKILIALDRELVINFPDTEVVNRMLRKILSSK